MGRLRDQDISTPLSQCVGRDISCAFRVGWPTGWAQDISSPLCNMSAKIYHVPSERVGPQTGAQDISTPPSKWVGWDISTPLPSGLADIYHMPSEWVRWDISTPLPSGLADIYPHPFPAGQPKYIICLQNRLARIISHAGSAQIYQMPS